MVKLNTAKGDAMGLAWMLKYDGTAIPVTVHVYGDEEDLAMSAEAALFLYVHSKESDVQRLVKDFFYNYCCYILTQWMYSSGDMTTDFKNLKECLKDHLGGNPGKSVNMSQDQAIDIIMSDVEFTEECYNNMCDIGYNITETAGAAVTRQLNEDYIRVRANGEFNTSPSQKGTIFFRISSKYRSWNNVICTFIDKYFRAIMKWVIVEEEPPFNSGGVRKQYIDMSMEDYFKEGIFIKCSRKSGLYGAVRNVLDNGGSFSKCFSLNANRQRISLVLQKIALDNARQGTIVINAPWAQDRE